MNVHTCHVCSRVQPLDKIDPETKRCLRPCWSKMRFGRRKLTLAERVAAGRSW